MTNELVKSAKAMGDLCQILNRNRETQGNTNFEFTKETDAGTCPHCGKKIVKHIVCEGARYHVHSYSTKGIHCSTQDCEDNHGIGCCVDRNGEPYERS